MRPSVATTLSLMLGALLMGAAAPAHAADGKAGVIAIEQPWARASVTTSGAAYLTIKNGGGEADRLTGVATPRADKAEVHVTEQEGGVMKMRAAGPLDIPAHGTVVFKPQGLHIMLLGLKGPLKAGETLPLTLHFDKAGDIAVNAPVQKAGASGPGAMPGMDHQGMQMDHQGMQMDHQSMPMDHQGMAPSPAK